MGFGNRIVSNTVTSSLLTELVSVEEVKDHMMVPFNEHDNLISGMITAARQYVERTCNISIGEQERVIHFTHNGTNPFFLPSQPLVSIDKLEYAPCNLRPLQEVSDYVLLGDMFTRFLYKEGRYVATVTVGYDSITMPTELRGVIKQVVMSMYEQRGDNSWTLPRWVREQMNQFRMKSWV